MTTAPSFSSLASSSTVSSSWNANSNHQQHHHHHHQHQQQQQQQKSDKHHHYHRQPQQESGPSMPPLSMDSAAGQPPPPAPPAPPSTGDEEPSATASLLAAVLKTLGTVTWSTTGKIAAPPIHLTRTVLWPALYVTLQDSLRAILPQRVRNWWRIIDSSMRHFVRAISVTVQGRLWQRRVMRASGTLLEATSTWATRQFFIDGTATLVQLVQAWKTPETKAVITEALPKLACRFVEMMSTAQAKQCFHDVADAMWALIELTSDRHTTVAVAEVCAYLCHALEMEHEVFRGTQASSSSSSSNKNNKEAAAQRRRDVNRHVSQTVVNPLFVGQRQAKSFGLSVEDVILDSFQGARVGRAHHLDPKGDDDEEDEASRATTPTAAGHLPVTEEGDDLGSISTTTATAPVVLDVAYLRETILQTPQPQPQAPQWRQEGLSCDNKGTQEETTRTGFSKQEETQLDREIEDLRHDDEEDDDEEEEAEEAEAEEEEEEPPKKDDELKPETNKISPKKKRKKKKKENVGSTKRQTFGKTNVAYAPEEEEEEEKTMGVANAMGNMTLSSTTTMANAKVPPDTSTPAVTQFYNSVEELMAQHRAKALHALSKHDDDDDDDHNDNNDEEWQVVPTLQELQEGHRRHEARARGGWLGLAAPAEVEQSNFRGAIHRRQPQGRRRRRSARRLGMDRLRRRLGSLTRQERSDDTPQILKLVQEWIEGHIVLFWMLIILALFMILTWFFLGCFGLYVLVLGGGGGGGGGVPTTAFSAAPGPSPPPPNEIVVRIVREGAAATTTTVESSPGAARGHRMGMADASVMNAPFASHGRYAPQAQRFRANPLEFVVEEEEEPRGIQHSPNVLEMLVEQAVTNAVVAQEEAVSESTSKNVIVTLVQAILSAICQALQQFLSRVGLFGQ